MTSLTLANLMQNNNELEYKNGCLSKLSLINEDYNIVNNQLNQLIAVNDNNIINCINTVSSLMTNVDSKITANVSTLISNNQQQIAHNKLAIKREENE